MAASDKLKQVFTLLIQQAVLDAEAAQAVADELYGDWELKQAHADELAQRVEDARASYLEATGEEVKDKA